MKIKEITFRKHGQYAPFCSIDMSAVMSINEGESEGEALEILKQFVTVNLDRCIAEAQGKSPVKEIKPVPSATVPDKNFSVPQQKTSIETALDLQASKTPSSPTGTVKLPDTDPQF